MSSPTPETAAVLSEEQRRRFADDGYLVIDDPCAPELLDGVREDFERLFRDDRGSDEMQLMEDGVLYTRHPSALNAGYHWQRIRDAWKLSDNARAIALSPTVVSIVEGLHGRKVMPFQTLNFPVGTQQPAHSDAMAFQSDPPGYMCGVWVALEDMDLDNGTLVYYPGSHKLPVPTWEEIGEALGKPIEREAYDTYPEFMQARDRFNEEFAQLMIERHSLEPEYATIRKGQAMIWSTNLLHGGSVQKDHSRTRHSQVTHYFFEGCRVYTPLRMEGEHIFWEYPVWIRDPVPDYSDAAVRQVVQSNVPAGASVLVMSVGNEELVRMDGVRAAHFPQGDEGSYLGYEVDDAQAVEELERLRAAGAEYLVVPAPQLPHLTNTLTELQNRLESRYRGIVRDGAYCAIYALD